MKKSCDCDYRNIDKYTMKFAELAKFLDSRINTYNHDNMCNSLYNTECRHVIRLMIQIILNICPSQELSSLLSKYREHW